MRGLVTGGWGVGAGKEEEEVETVLPQQYNTHRLSKNKLLADLQHRFIFSVIRASSFLFNRSEAGNALLKN